MKDLILALARRGKTVILVDDGLATGATMLAATRALRQQQPAQVIVAVPIAAAAICKEFQTEVDEVVCAGRADGLFVKLLGIESAAFDAGDLGTGVRKAATLLHQLVSFRRVFDFAPRILLKDRHESETQGARPRDRKGGPGASRARLRGESVEESRSWRQEPAEAVVKR